MVPTLFLTTKASVMLTMNLWSEVGLCNGATGKVIDIIYADNHSPSNLPVAVIVQFDHYTGPSFIDTYQNVFQFLLLLLLLSPSKHFMKDSNYH